MKRTLVIFLAVLMLLAVGVVSLGASLAADAPGPSQTVQEPELGREWVWHKRAITFDHMYRSPPAENQ